MATAYTHALARAEAPAASELRSEVAGRPRVGQLIEPGQLVATSYGTGPYRVETVTAHEVYPGFSAWSLSLSKVADGVLDGEVGAFSVNEVVAEWEEEVPHFRKLFRANTDEVLLLDGAAYRVNRRGQYSLF